MKKIMHFVPCYRNYSETFIWNLIDNSSELYETKIVSSLKINNNYDKHDVYFIKGKDTNIYFKFKY
ncbi:hypothetical protein, partial [Aliivibrio fischeri]|uniref:hypothetical protein n=1 Tax=Aliivibrio fischeri TaxID=668 RepID=UPI001969D9B7